MPNGRFSALPTGWCVTSIVAEGVETQEQLSFLSDEGCDAVQGYFIGRPQPIGQYAAVVGRSGGGMVEPARKTG